MSSWAGWLLCVVGFTLVRLDLCWCRTGQMLYWGLAEHGSDIPSVMLRGKGTGHWADVSHGVQRVCCWQCCAMPSWTCRVACLTLDPQQLGKSDSFSMGNPIPADTVGGCGTPAPAGKGWRGTRSEGQAGTPSPHSHPGSVPEHMLPHLQGSGSPQVPAPGT